MNSRINKLKDCEDLYLHGLGNSISKIIKPGKVDIGRSQRLHYYWIKDQKAIGISDLKKIINSSGFLLLLRKAKFLSARGSHHLINIPKILDKELAYLCGYHLGDGHITKTCIGIHYMDSKEQLVKISKIYQKVFGISLKIKKDPTKNAFNGTVTSKAIASILHYCLEIPIGRKGKLIFPSWIKGKLKKEFIIGFLDAEFGVCKRGFQFSGSSIDKEFMEDIQRDLKKLGLNLKKYGPYSTKTHINPIWFLKTSRISDMYWLEKNGFIRHPNHLKILKEHIINRAPVV